MHPTATLDFHSPYIDGDETASKDPTLLAKAQERGVVAVANLLDSNMDHVRVDTHLVGQNPMAFVEPSSATGEDRDSRSIFGTPFWHFYPPETKLVQAHDTAKANLLALGAPLVDPTPDAGDGTWVHAGSTVKLRISGPIWKITYDKPSDQARGLGIRTGTVLFEGKQSGREVSGKTYQVSSRCGAVPYDISGSLVDNRKVELRGKAPLLNRDCGVQKTPNLALTFEFHPNAMTW